MIVPPAEEVFSEIRPGAGKPDGSRKLSRPVGYAVITAGTSDFRKTPDSFRKKFGLFNRPPVVLPCDASDNPNDSRSADPVLGRAPERFFHQASGTNQKSETLISIL